VSERVSTVRKGHASRVGNPGLAREIRSSQSLGPIVVREVYRRSAQDTQRECYAETIY